MKIIIYTDLTGRKKESLVTGVSEAARQFCLKNFGTVHEFKVEAWSEKEAQFAVEPEKWEPPEEKEEPKPKRVVGYKKMVKS